MRLILVGWGGARRELVATVHDLEKQIHEIVYWVRADDDFKLDQSEFPNTIFHDHFAALEGKPAEPIKLKNFAPAPAELLKSLAETESIVLTQMNKKFGNLLVDERKHFYYHLVSYWQGVLTELKPDAIIFPVTPHTVYDYVIFALAKLLKIKTVMFDFTRVGDRVLAMSDYRVGVEELREALNSDQKNHSPSELSADVKRYYEQQISVTSDTTPPDTQKVVGSNRFKLLAKLKLQALVNSLKNGTLVKNFAGYFVKALSQNLKKEYQSVEQPPNFSKPYIYVPLNYQPEASTSPLGGVFVDQILLIETLAAALPEGYNIYVKEHPYQWIPRGLKYFDSRYRGYYQKISKIKNVQLVPLKTSTYELINRSVAVATVTGTAGWEGLLRLKPALIFGYPWFRDCPGILKVNGVESCRVALAKIISGFKPTREQINNYLFHFDKLSFAGYLDAYGKEISELPESQNQINFTNAILSALKPS